ncbi:MAG TPA: patatin family protein [Candidatus Aphodomonas merdavium]|nr:patatin family protein [Candidatus Aphodomonas merdavium]
MKTGLVLEGGAMRGMFTAGVLDVLMEAGVAVDGAVGVSAGAAFGCNYKSRQIGRAIRYNMTYCRDPRYCSLRSLVRTGDLYGVDFCYRVIPMELDPFDVETFARNPMPFYAVCTDLRTGKPVYHLLQNGGEEDMAWIRASASMPMVSRIVRLDGHELLDGGIADSIPLRFFESIGYERNIVVLTQPQGFIKEKNRYLPLLRVALRKYPKAFRALAQRHEAYNEAVRYVRQREEEGAAFVLCPDEPLHIGAVERDAGRLRAVYEAGRAVTGRRLPAMQAFLAAAHGE